MNDRDQVIPPDGGNGSRKTGTRLPAAERIGESPGGRRGRSLVEDHRPKITAPDPC
jgi:hypothetical protein